MIFKQFIVSISLVLLAGCKTSTLNLEKIEGEQIPISEAIQPNQDITDFIKPYHDHVVKTLDSVLAYAPASYKKSDGEYNTALGNLMADIVYEQSNPIFKSRSNHDIDFVILNYGGIRAPISKGDITLKTAYEIMPFENSIVVVNVKGKNVNEAMNYLSKAKRPHPVSQLKLVINSDFNVTEALVKGQPIEEDKTYYIATNDYLYNGGDHMTFFKPNDSLYVLNYKWRNAIIDYFTKTDTINPVIDDRFIQIQ
ncbi:5'-nucleotidase' [Formosa agariphila KMM 3901]|uniref:5'-nucleotidase n=1 Tax=Formosa agariphila (strain DSM 15362 / KCTC 12365 / LMG 23005 / KMM 3901 / M-2Alg 35-1) TaxID=1347342 RepID=T2KMV7_FORAG|nr:5'-nucleotidase [Formosa agariphila]CDF80085.1 5'-nucleotidase' [Formosa agariphila KMM 3901]